MDLSFLFAPEAERQDVPMYILQLIDLLFYPPYGWEAGCPYAHSAADRLVFSFRPITDREAGCPLSFKSDPKAERQDVPMFILQLTDLSFLSALNWDAGCPYVHSTADNIVWFFYPPHNWEAGCPYIHLTADRLAFSIRPWSGEAGCPYIHHTADRLVFSIRPTAERQDVSMFTLSLTLSVSLLSSPQLRG